MRVYLCVLLVLFVGCSSIDRIMELATPSLEVFMDNVDGTVTVRQLGVGASTIDEPLHALGAEWNQRTPDLVYVTATLKGTQTITALTFIADGRLIEDLKGAGATTEADGGGQIKMTMSSRRFAMPWPDFIALANAESVKMRISRISDYTESSFAQSSLIRSKLRPFVEQVRALRAALK